MIIKQGNAREISDWFVSDKTEETVLCIFLGAAKNDVEVLSGLIDSASHVDTIIGRKIGFLLCAPGLSNPSSINSGRSGEHIVSAEYKRLSKAPDIARDFVARFDLDRLARGQFPVDRDYYKQASEALARSTVTLVPEFMEMYGIDARELPCMVTLFKGLEEFRVIELPSTLTQDMLIEWLTDLREVVERVERNLLSEKFSVWDIISRLEKVNKHDSEINAKLNKIEFAITGICNKYIDSIDESYTFISAMRSAELDESAKRELVNKFISEYPSSKNDGRWQKIIQIQGRIDQLRSEGAENLDRDLLLSLSGQLERERRKLMKISDAVSDLRVGSGRGRTGRRRPYIRSSGNAWDAADKVNTVTDLLEKTTSAITLVGRFLGLGA